MFMYSKYVNFMFMYSNMLSLCTVNMFMNTKRLYTANMFMIMYIKHIYVYV